MPTSDNAPAGAPFTFASNLGRGLALLIVGNFVSMFGALSSVAALAVIGAIAALIGLVLTLVAVTRQAAAIEAIAAALNVTQPSAAPTQVSNAEFFGKQ
ncbi:hypothetical protein [Demequina subtropica]|uniref:hypothetical protein n=1 Tax=Demequina subtropica TaxID=1638989 RepID=UPI000781C64D|nr:hypothetical protein [Demequina subtropica]